ncbi:hypothetical protein EDD22DRAFT_265803 [Suillus occidentalis]|nr:hypothetical protein EDD22DRAFT_265803 [Suillus occidentalis]
MQLAKPICLNIIPHSNRLCVGMCINAATHVSPMPQMLCRSSGPSTTSTSTCASHSTLPLREQHTPLTLRHFLITMPDIPITPDVRLGSRAPSPETPSSGNTSSSSSARLLCFLVRIIITPLSPTSVHHNSPSLCTASLRSIRPQLHATAYLHSAIPTKCKTGTSSRARREQQRRRRNAASKNFWARSRCQSESSSSAHS